MGDMAPSAMAQGGAEMLSNVKKKDEKKVWSTPPKIDTSAITGIRAITAIQIASGHWLLFYGSKNQVPIDFQGGLAVSTFFMITGFVLYVGYRHKVCNTETFSYWTFIKRRYARALPLHWICLILYAPFVFLNYAQIRDDYNFWQNKSGEVNLIMGIVLTPFLMHSWIFSLCYWNSVCWSLSCQLGFYFCFPWMCRKLAKLEEKIEEEAASSIKKRSLVDRIKEKFFCGSSSDGDEETIESTKNAMTKSLLLSTELAGYRKYILRFYHLSSFLPLTMMGIMNSTYFRNIWKDKDFDGRASTLVTALDTDLDGVRAYFCARAWFPVRLPLFFMGMLLGAARMRVDDALRVEDRREEPEEAMPADESKSPYRKKWASRTDALSLLLTVWIITSMIFSGIYADSKNIRIFNEFILTLPVAAWLFGLTACTESYSYRFLTKKIPQRIGQWSFAIYLLQFPFYSYWTAMEIHSMNLFPPCDRTAEHIRTWSDCFRNYEGSDTPRYPDVIVIAFVVMLVGLSAIVHEYVEKPTTNWVQTLVG
jgi:peptidoglycan/LPS O-acetylase OafA/YrhL